MFCACPTPIHITLLDQIFSLAPWSTAIDSKLTSQALVFPLQLTPTLLLGRSVQAYNSSSLPAQQLQRVPIIYSPVHLPGWTCSFSRTCPTCLSLLSAPHCSPPLTWCSSQTCHTSPPGHLLIPVFTTAAFPLFKGLLVSFLLISSQVFVESVNGS
jgi:hypothetical protein